MTDTNITSKKVFIVEDDTFLGRILKDQVAEAGIQTSLFTTAEALLDALKTNLPDILLLDIFLPGMNGLDALEQLRKDDRTKGIKVIVVSNTDERKDRDRAGSLNAQFMIKATTEPQDIVKAVTDALKAN
ncbi:MAG: hypothetical protein RJB39_382 [Candidatus Parcubacteria bacterium]